jgi:hypothetical protein
MPAARLFGSESPFLRKRINPGFDADEMLLQHLPNLLLHMKVAAGLDPLTNPPINIGERRCALAVPGVIR